MADRPASYSIEELLNSGIQPFGNLPDDDERSYVIGGDGKMYESVPAVHTDREPRNPWAPDGYAYRALSKAHRALSEPLAGLTPLQLAKLGEVVGNVIDAAERLQERV